MSTEKREVEPDSATALFIIALVVFVALAANDIDRIADALERAYPEQRP